MNGFWLGTEPSGYAAQVYDLTEYLNYGGENVVAVSVPEAKVSGKGETASSTQIILPSVHRWSLEDPYLYTVRTEVLRLLYAVFLLDLQNVQDRTIVHRQLSQRIEEIFIGFIRLLPDNFIEHHDIPFYASRLCISPVYLSRVVRQVSGHTVIDYINYMLLMEASFLLRTSKLSIAQISDRLHFADTPSFSKFFSRMKGLSPREYRES